MKEKIRPLLFWDAQARWQNTWLQRCDYHRDIIPLIIRQTSPGWKVLDIGAGSGALALPLQNHGCKVTALEPSQGMRALLRRTAGARQVQNFTIDGRTWEMVPVPQIKGFQLILACNSLHLTTLGFSRALAKIFQAGPEHVCVISESCFLKTDTGQSACDHYQLSWQQNLTANSSLAYRSLAEAWEHFHHRWDRLPTLDEKNSLQAQLQYRDNFYWLWQNAYLTVWWWSRISMG
ncbi:MAG: class I SAM-dependent methyltransferase [Deltaproteobacteria bacterium]|nr:class I SAM-dependent methyltransferase [Deltaproteobacteria bacterium]